jgi:hypothetical protein
MFGLHLKLAAQTTDTEPPDNLFQFDSIALQGTGCPQDKTTIITTPDQKTVTFLFDRFMAAIPQNDSINDNDDLSDENPQRSRRDTPTLSHKVCVMKVGMKLPVNMALQSFVIKSDYRGYTYVEPGSKTVYRSFLLEKRGLGIDHLPIKKSFYQKVWSPMNTTSHIDEEWTIQDEQQIPLKGKCAKRGQRHLVMAFKQILLAKMLPQQRLLRVLERRPLDIPKATIQLDSHDLKGTLTLGFKMVPCQGS